MEDAGSAPAKSSLPPRRRARPVRGFLRLISTDACSPTEMAATFRSPAANLRYCEEFIRHPGRVLSRDYLLDALGGKLGPNASIAASTLLIGRLRKKIAGADPEAASPDRHSGRRGLSLRRVDAVFVVRAKPFIASPDVAGQWTPRRGPRERSSVGGAARDFWGDGWSEGVDPEEHEAAAIAGTRVRGGRGHRWKPPPSGAEPPHVATPPAEAVVVEGAKFSRADKAFRALLPLAIAITTLLVLIGGAGFVDRQYKPTRDRRL